MACASVSSHRSLVRSTPYSCANQSRVKRLVETSRLSHVTTLLMVVSSTMKALIYICSPPFSGQVDLLLARMENILTSRQSNYFLVWLHLTMVLTTRHCASLTISGVSLPCFHRS